MVLKDLKVVELATWIAGPGCTMIMADWGADVIKVESAAGDAVRGFFPDTAESPGNPIFSMENRGKRGMVLDINKPAGREAMMTLLRGADVFVTNVRPGGLARARLDYDSLRVELPRLIYASVTGFGLEGDEIDAPAFDMTAFWNRAGVSAAFNPPGIEPLSCRPAFGDHVTAMATLAGVLGALHERHGSGRGRLVEASLIRTGMYALGWDNAVRLRYGEGATAQHRDDRPSAITGYFHTADDRWVFVQPRGPQCFPALMRAIGRPEFADDARYVPPIENLDCVREIRGVLDEVFARLILTEALELLTRADVAHAPLARLAEVHEDPQAQAAGCFTVTPDGRGGAFAAPNTPVRFPGAPESPRRPPPKLGEHTREILAEAGHSPEAIDAMLAAGAAVQGEEP